MLFTSMEFLFLFFPITLGIYYLLPTGARNYWLFFASLIFYGWGEPKFLFIMLFSILFNYLMALRIEELKRENRLRRLILAITIIGNLGILFVFKYMNFVNSTLRKWIPSMEGHIAQTEFILPIGISFFTFQALSYVIDVYRGERAQKNICFLGLYIALFPRLIAGPIVRYNTIRDQIKERRTTLDDLSAGLLRFLIGFNKKMLLADLVSEVADAAFSAGPTSAAQAWLGAVCYTLQIYLDFSAYSDMAIGLGRMFGFHFLENFNYPYISKTVTEFWRRWHISLSSWFRDYLYIPLGGSRVRTKGRLVFNLFVVWLATGAWHGASWNFIAWGMMYWVVLTAEKLLIIPERLEGKRFIGVVYRCFTMLIVVLAWVLFRSDGLHHAVDYLLVMFGRGVPLTDASAGFYLREYAIVFVAGIIGSLPLLPWMRKRMSGKSEKGYLAYQVAGYGVQLVLFILSVSFLVMNAHNPFIYINF